MWVLPGLLLPLLSPTLMCCALLCHPGLAAAPAVLHGHNGGLPAPYNFTPGFAAPLCQPSLSAGSCVFSHLQMQRIFGTETAKKLSEGNMVGLGGSVKRVSK